MYKHTDYFGMRATGALVTISSSFSYRKTELFDNFPHANGNPTRDNFEKG